MVMSSWLGGLAVGRAHVLVAAPRGAFGVRARLERAVLARGWALANSPADADVLAVCGDLGEHRNEVLLGAVDSVWAGMPGPRVRVDVPGEASVASALDRAAQALLDHGAHASDAEERMDHGEMDHGEMDHGEMDHGEMDHGEMDHGDMDHGDMDHGDMDHGDMDHGDMDHGDMDHGDMDHGDMDHGDMDHGDMDHGDMDHGDMEMSPGGIPLAEGSEDDRDGLEMDVLHVPLGPVLRHWPSGLVLHCTLHGDLVAQARAEMLPVSAKTDSAKTSAGGASIGGAAALRCDAVADLLALAGWPAGEALALRARDAFLEGDEDTARTHLQALSRRTGRNRILSWMLRGLGVLRTSDLPGASGESRHDVLLGDVHDRLLALIDTAAASPRPGGSAMAEDEVAELLSRLVEGLELASARLVVSSLDVPSLLGAQEVAGV